jgi:TonB family protein
MNPRHSRDRTRSAKGKVARVALRALITVLGLALINIALATEGNKVFAFYGKIQAVDPGTKSFTLRANKRPYVFSVTDQTKIFGSGNPLQFADLKQGQEAEVNMKVGPGGKGMAVLIILASGSREVRSSVLKLEFQSLFTAKTARGQIISGPELTKLITYMPEADAFSTTIDYSAAKQGMFLMSVSPGGMVSNVEVLSSIGYAELDEKMKRWLIKWRFQPGSVTEVRVPFSFSGRLPGLARPKPF